MGAGRRNWSGWHHRRASLRDDILVTNMSGQIMADSMSEAAIMLMLALSRGLPRALRTRVAANGQIPGQPAQRQDRGIFGVAPSPPISCPSARRLA